MSPDEDFSHTGAKSGISYIESYKAYKDMIIKQAETPRFKQILSSFNELSFGTKPDPPKRDVHFDQGDYDDEIQEYLRDNGPPTEPTDEMPADEMPVDEIAEDDMDDTPPSPRSGHRASTSIIVQESDTIRTSSKTISITTRPSEPQADEMDITVVLPKKARPAPRKKVTNPALDANTADTAPAPTTRGTRTSARQAAPPPEQVPQQATRTSGRKRTKN